LASVTTLPICGNVAATSLSVGMPTGAASSGALAGSRLASGEALVVSYPSPVPGRAHALSASASGTAAMTATIRFQASTGTSCRTG
jgi:hypothetical protein